MWKDTKWRKHQRRQKRHFEGQKMYRRIGQTTKKSPDKSVERSLQICVKLQENFSKTQKLGKSFRKLRKP
jgi:hypothetical protein